VRASAAAGLEAELESERAAAATLRETVAAREAALAALGGVRTDLEASVEELRRDLAARDTELEAQAATPPLVGASLCVCVCVCVCVRATIARPSFLFEACPESVFICWAEEYPSLCKSVYWERRKSRRRSL